MTPIEKALNLLDHMAVMPEYDQDDAHRLRNAAKTSAESIRKDLLAIDDSDPPCCPDCGKPLLRTAAEVEAQAVHDDSDLDEPLIRISCAAIRHKSNSVVIPGVRHYDTIMRNVIVLISGSNTAAEYDGWYGCEQGFLTNKQEFVTREQAWFIAEKAKQIRPHPSQRPGRLHSEDLY